MYEKALNKRVEDFSAKELASLARASQIFDEESEMEVQRHTEPATISLKRKQPFGWISQSRLAIDLGSFSIRQFFPNVFTKYRDQ